MVAVCSANFAMQISDGVSISDPIPKSPLPVGVRSLCLTQCYLDHTSLPVEWHLIPTNSLSRLHECDRQTDRQIDGPCYGICQNMRRHYCFQRCRLIIITVIIITKFMSKATARVHPVHLTNAEHIAERSPTVDQLNQLGPPFRV